MQWMRIMKVTIEYCNYIEFVQDFVSIYKSDKNNIKIIEVHQNEI